MRELGPTNLELLGEGVDFASLFVVIESVGPKKLRLLLKSVPCLELANASRLTAALRTLDHLLQLSDRERICDYLIIIFQSTRWQVDERLKIGILVPGNVRDTGVQGS